MADPLYALEKLSDAVYILTTHPGRVQERLFEAFLYIRRINPDEIPDKVLRHQLVGVQDDLSFDEPVTSRVRATLDKTSDEDASEIARRILDLYHRLDHYLAHRE